MLTHVCLSPAEPQQTPDEPQTPASDCFVFVEQQEFTSEGKDEADTSDGRAEAPEEAPGVSWRDQELTCDITTSTTPTVSPAG